MNKIRVGISGINAVDNPGPGIGVARSLKEDPNLDVEIIGLAYDSMEPGLYMDWVVDKSYLLPFPSNNSRDFIGRILEIKDNHGLDVIIPNLDAELPMYIKHATLLAENNIATFLPDMSQFLLRGKDRLQEIAQATGLELPKTKIVYSIETLHEALEEVGYPLMIKGIYYKAYKVSSLEEAMTRYHGIVAEWGYPIIVQEVINGQELNVIGLGDGTGKNMGMVGIKKVSVTSLGKIWTGVTIFNETMMTAAADFIKEFKWKGPFELECMINDQQIYLIEVNPRFPAWVYFATGVGINLPARLLRSLLDKDMDAHTQHDYEPGKLFIRYTSELVIDREPWQTIMLTGETA